MQSMVAKKKKNGFIHIRCPNSERIFIFLFFFTHTKKLLLLFLVLVVSVFVNARSRPSNIQKQIIVDFSSLFFSNCIQPHSFGLYSALHILILVATLFLSPKSTKWASHLDFNISFLIYPNVTNFAENFTKHTGQLHQFE